MRKAGIGTLGLVGGVLLAMIVQDLLATAFLQGGSIPVALGIALGFLVPVLGVAGVIVAIQLDNRSTNRRSKGTPGV
jgi:hypothetical protein